MPISDEHRLIFLHVAKAGGSSVTVALGIREGEASLYRRDYASGHALQHLPYAALKSLIERKWPNKWRYSKFTIVRNPFDRLCSDYEWRKSGGLPLGELSFPDFVEAACASSSREDSEDFAAKYLGHFTPQVEYVGADVEVLKLETLKTEWPEFAERHGLPRRLPRENDGRRQTHYAKYYTQALADKVSATYAEDLRRFGYRFEGTPKPAGSFASMLASYPKKLLAVCLCVVDELRHEGVWRRWLDAGGAELWIHAKHPEKLSPWASKHALPLTFAPEWNDIRLVRAMLALTKAALKGRASAIVFGTESCLPVRSVQACSSALCGTQSFLGEVQKRPPNRWVRERQWDKVEDGARVVKAVPGWISLARRHAELVLGAEAEAERRGRPLWRSFENAFAPEELYFATVLATKIDVCGDSVARRAATFSSWPPGASHPEQFENLTADLLDRFGSCLFARKFVKSVDPDHWASLVLRRQHKKYDDDGDDDDDFDAAAPKVKKPRLLAERSSIETPKGRHSRQDETFASMVATFAAAASAEKKK
ncbi:hypothetical protein CTAYLR_006363 [Chrysophaeum taylorii]|uniref:Sulfotransferase family protein n=1 Tax=Chrysophaeum taylorii TaxID=2483200 RepID=A0AAD7XI03_9STRA|nr:hypothetical protein CTAYLR_006363 [Chrysophaeum taylorii]